MVSALSLQPDVDKRPALPSQGVVKRKHASRYRDSNSASPAFNLESVPVLSDLLHLHDYISGPRGGKGQICSGRRIGALLPFDLSVKLVNESRSAVSRRVKLILLLELGAYIIPELCLHGKRAEFKWSGGVQKVLIRDACKDTRNSFLGIDLVKIHVLGSTVDGLKAIGLDGTTGANVNVAVGLKDVCDNSAAGVGLSFEEVKEVPRQRLVQGNAVLVLLVEPSRLVLSHMLGEGDCRKQVQIITMNTLQLRAERGEQGLCLI